MKFLVVVILIVAAVVAAVPPRRNSRFSNQFQRLEDSYQPPAKQPVPHTVYGPPPQEYGPPSTPQPEYGPPQEEATEEGTTEVTTTIEPESEPIDSNNGTRSRGKLTNKGAYYIYHPSGLLQKVLYTTKDDVKNMAYTAQVKYQNVEPIREPIFTYDPKTLVFTKFEG